MDQQLQRVAGLDVHRKTIAVCVRVPGEHGEQVPHRRTFGTTAAELLILRDWLEAHGVTDVALESTGVYWKPVFYVLEEAVRCVLVNPQHVQKVPGRKTDVQDCVWLAQFHLDYREPGADYFDHRHAQRVTQRAVRTLERHGYRVTIEPAA